MHADQGRNAPAELLFNRSLSIYEKSFGYDHPKVALSLNNRSELYRTQGNYAQAEPLLKRSLAIFEKVFGYDNPNVATSLNNLALLYSSQGNNAQAEPLYKRALAIIEKVFGPDHPSVALNLQNLGSIYVETGDHTQAEQLLKRSLAISERIYGPDHPSIALTLNNLALLYSNQGNHAQAEPLYKRSLAVYVKVFGRDHPTVALILRNLAELYGLTGSPILAEQLLKQSLAISEEIYGPDNGDVAKTLNYLAALYVNLNGIAKALEHSRAATKISRRNSSAQPVMRLGAPKIESKWGLRLHLDLLAKDQETASSLGRTAEGFDLMQFIPSENAARAIAQSAARQLAPNAQLATAVRRQQDVIQHHRHLDSMLIKALGEPPAKRRAQNEARLREEIRKLEAELATLGKQIANEFPDYAALIGGEPLPLAEAQALLRPDEALLAFVSNKERMHVAIVRPGRATLLDLPLENKEMVALVQRIRASLLAENPLTTAYNADAAHALYRQLFAPLLPHLDGVRDLLVVPEGALASLPLGVLLEKPTPDGRAPGLQDYRQLDWLAKRFNFTTLPAVVSLKALRKLGKAPAAGQQPFFGIGDPLLDGPDDANSAVRGTDRKSVSAPDLETTGIAALRKFPSLPDTADELRAIAKSLGGAPDAIHLRLDATETRLKQQPLERYRVLGLATHGLLAGEIKGFGEPGLVLTPPATASTEDDGFLGASEVAQLKLNADWVILSACNTAAADGTPGAANLSGLAKSFFYAGARTLLVSHWPVISSATTRLITDTLELQAGNPKLGKAGALRQAMLNMINDEESPEFAHPAFWAPFVVVGEGK
jgi:CHAT domain-containing protein/tetratricopeptide (TPR) repeat protein